MSKKVSTPAHWEKGDIIEGVNWNTIPDQLDLDVWNRATANFWLPEKIAVSNDIPSWNNLLDVEQRAVLRVFTGLTMLDTIQASVGAVSLIQDAKTPHEEAVYTNFGFMEAVHAKSYSNIFMTLSTTEDINESFRWSRENENLQRKGSMILESYKDGDPMKKKIASVLLESFLFYSGFYLPLRLAGMSKLPNSADIIQLICRDEAIHGYYIGAKFQQDFEKLSDTEKAELQEFAVELMLDLYDNEIEYTESIYDDLGWTEDVKSFLRYNGNKAMQNLGFASVFPADETNFHNSVRSALGAEGDENHDFFSGSGSSYTLGVAESTEDDDWDFD